jgi:hypothetical protein
MARTWLSVTVELLGGRGEEPWPWPGRIFAVGPTHTFMDLADAINTAFARWDRAHLSQFVLPDGRVVTDDETALESTASMGGPMTDSLDIATAKVAKTLAPGAEFQYTFDFGDNWTHRCQIGEEMVDPVEVLGIRPVAPLPYWGWGSIPDQYGRRWQDDDGQGPLPKRPTEWHPMVLGAWPAQEQVPQLDMQEVRASIATRDAARFLAAVKGRDVDDALQQIAPGVPMALEQRREDAEPVALSIINRLSWRGGEGDQALADDLLAAVRGEALNGRVLSVDLEMLSSALEGDAGLSWGGYVDLQTGDVYDEHMLDDDDEIDVEEDPDRWLEFSSQGSRDGWRDMESFAERQHDPGLRERLERAIEGKGAFRRFRDLVHDEGIAEQWYVFSTDRQIGRARAFLANQGIRVP